MLKLSQKTQEVFHWAIFLVAASLYTVIVTTQAQSYLLDAVDLLGQSDNGLPNFEQRGSNNGTSNVNARGFSSPTGIAVDKINHRMFVADSGNARVMVFNLDASNNPVDLVADYVLGKPTLATMNCTPVSASCMAGVSDVEYDSVNNRLFVSDNNANRVLVFDFNEASNVISNGMAATAVIGQVDFDSTIAGTSQTALNQPRGVLVDNTGNRLFIADFQNMRVAVYDITLGSLTATGTPATNVIGQTDFDSNLAQFDQVHTFYPVDMAYDEINSRLFVSQYHGQRITTYDVNASTFLPGINGLLATAVIGQNSYTSQGGGVAANKLNYPLDMQYESANSKLYVVDSGANRVLVFDAGIAMSEFNLSATEVMGQATMGEAIGLTGQFGLNGPAGLFYDQDQQKLWVTEQNNNRIISFARPFVAEPTMVVGSETYQQKVMSTNELQTYLKLDGDYSDALSSTTVTSSGAPLFSQDQTGPNGVVLNGIEFAASTSDKLSITNHDYSSDYTYELWFKMATNTPGLNPLISFNDGAGTIFSMNAMDVGDGTNRLIVNGTWWAWNPDTNNYLGTINVSDNQWHHLSVNRYYDGVYLDNILSYTNHWWNGYGLAISNNAEILLGADHAGNYFSGSIDELAIYNSSLQRDTISNHFGKAPELVRARDLIGQQDGFGNPDWNKTNANNEIVTAIGFDIDNRGNSTDIDDINHRLFVADRNNGRVLIYELDDNNRPADMEADYVLGQTDFASKLGALTQSGLNGPESVAYDNVHNKLFVGDRNANRIMVYNLANGISNGMNAESVIGQRDFKSNSCSFSFCGSNSLVYDARHDRLFAGDDDENRVDIFDLSQGTGNGLMPADYIGQDGVNGNQTNNLSIGGFRDYVHGLAYDETNDLLYTSENWGGNRVQQFDVNPAKLATYNSADYQTKVLNSEGLVSYWKMDGDGSDSKGRNHLVNSGAVNFDTGFVGGTSGAYLGGGGAKMYSNGVAGIPVGSSSRTIETWVSDQGCDNGQINTIWSYGQTGNNLSLYVTHNPGANVIHLAYNGGEITADYNNNCWNYSKIDVVYDGTRLALRLNGSEVAGVDVVLDTIINDNRLYIGQDMVIDEASFTGNIDELAIYNRALTDKELVSHAIKAPAEAVIGQGGFNQFGDDRRGTGIDTFYQNLGIGLDNENSVLSVADSYNHRIMLFKVGLGMSSDISAFNTLGQSNFSEDISRTTRNGLNSPSAVLMSSNKLMYVTDKNNSRIMIFQMPYLETKSLANGETNQLYTQSLSTIGGTASYTYALASGTLPTGLTLGADGSITGTPTVAGSYTFKVRVEDSSKTDGTGESSLFDQKTYTLVISSPVVVAPVVTPVAQSTVGNSAATLVSTKPMASPVVSSAKPGEAKTASFSVVINGGNKTTASQTVNLALAGGPEAAKMVVSESPELIGADLENYATAATKQLSAGFGPKTIYVMFRADDGRSSAIVSATIDYVDAKAAGMNEINLTTALAKGKTPTKAGVKATKINIKNVVFGKTNNDIKAVQEKLKSLKLLKSATGKYGTDTRTAITNFQKKNKLKATGKVDAATLNKLGL